MARRWRPRVFPTAHVSLMLWDAARRNWFDEMPQYSEWLRDWYWSMNRHGQVAYYPDEPYVSELEWSELCHSLNPRNTEYERHRDGENAVGPAVT